MPEAVQLALVGVFSAVLGGPVWTFLSSWLNIGRTKMESELARLDNRVATLSKELAACEEKHGVLEGRLRAVEQRTTSYFAMWIKDRHGRIIWLNDKAFLTLFAPLGYTREELDGKTFRDLLDPAAANEVERLDRAALAHPGATQSLLVQLHPDLPYLVVIKVASVSESGEVQYEGCAYNPSDPDLISAIQIRRQVLQREQSSRSVLGTDQRGAGDRPGDVDRVEGPEGDV